MRNLRTKLTKKQPAVLLKTLRTTISKRSLKSVILALTLNASFIFCSPITLATPTSDEVTPEPSPVPKCDTCDMLGQISTTLSEVHTKNVDLIYDLLRRINTSIAEGNSNIFNLIAGQPTVEKSLNKRTSNLINYYLEGMKVQEYEKSALAYAPLPLPNVQDSSIKPYPDFVFSETNDAITKTDNTASIKIEGMLNMDTLMGPTKYTDEEKSGAQWLIRYLEALSPPPDIINVSESFVIPFSPDSDTGYTAVIFKDDPKLRQSKKQKVTALKKELNAIPAYREYLVSYRSAIAARSMMLNTLLKLYQDRLTLPSSSSAKQAPTQSPAEIEYESATRRLSTDYYNKIMGSTSEKIDPASPITIEREMLFLLAEIHHDLYQMRQQNDRLLAMQAVSGLQMSQMGSLLGGSKTKKIAKLIYCSPSLGHSNDKACTENTQSSDSSSVELPTAPAE